MRYTVSITSQGQLSIPTKIRQQLGLSKNSKAIVTIKDGGLLIKPVPDLLNLRGSIQTDKKPPTRKEIQDILASEMTK